MKPHLFFRVAVVAKCVIEDREFRVHLVYGTVLSIGDERNSLYKKHCMESISYCSSFTNSHQLFIHHPLFHHKQGQGIYAQDTTANTINVRPQ